MTPVVGSRQQQRQRQAHTIQAHEWMECGVVALALHLVFDHDSSGNESATASLLSWDWKNDNETDDDNDDEDADQLEYWQTVALRRQWWHASCLAPHITCWKQWIRLLVQVARQVAYVPIVHQHEEEDDCGDDQDGTKRRRITATHLHHYAQTVVPTLTRAEQAVVKRRLSDWMQQIHQHQHQQLGLLPNPCLPSAVSSYGSSDSSPGSCLALVHALTELADWWQEQEQSLDDHDHGNDDDKPSPSLQQHVLYYAVLLHPEESRRLPHSCHPTTVLQVHPADDCRTQHGNKNHNHKEDANHDTKQGPDTTVADEEEGDTPIAIRRTGSSLFQVRLYPKPQSSSQPQQHSQPPVAIPSTTAMTSICRFVGGLWNQEEEEPPQDDAGVEARQDHIWHWTGHACRCIQCHVELLLSSMDSCQQTTTTTTNIITTKDEPSWRRQLREVWTIPELVQLGRWYLTRHVMFQQQQEPQQPESLPADKSSSSSVTTTSLAVRARLLLKTAIYHQPADPSRTTVSSLSSVSSSVSPFSLYEYWEAWHALGAIALMDHEFVQAQFIWDHAHQQRQQHQQTSRDETNHSSIPKGLQLQWDKLQAYQYLDRATASLSPQSSTGSLVEQVVQPWVYRSRTAVVSSESCRQVLEWATVGGGAWTRERHYAVPTCDIAVHTVPPLLDWYQSWFRKTLEPLLRQAFLPPHGNSNTDHQPCFYTHDAFVVKYTAREETANEDKDETNQTSNNNNDNTYLPIHVDESTHSIVLALNDGYEGGGTFVVANEDDTRDDCVIRLETGQVLCFRGDLVRHGGEPVTRGTRYILAAFLYYDTTSRDDLEQQQQQVEGSTNRASSQRLQQQTAVSKKNDSTKQKNKKRSFHEAAISNDGSGKEFCFGFSIS